MNWWCLVYGYAVYGSVGLGSTPPHPTSALLPVCHTAPIPCGPHPLPPHPCPTKARVRRRLPPHPPVLLPQECACCRGELGRRLDQRGTVVDQHSCGLLLLTNDGQTNSLALCLLPYDPNSDPNPTLTGIQVTLRNSSSQKIVPFLGQSLNLNPSPSLPLSLCLSLTLRLSLHSSLI